MSSLPVFEYPTSIALVDDDPLFVEAFQVVFQGRKDLNLFSNAESALSYFTVDEHKSFLDRKHFLRGLQDDELYACADKFPVDLDYTRMRQSVYEKLIAVQAALPNRWKIRLYEAFRSRKVQAMLFEETRKHLGKQFPEKSADEIFLETTKQVAPVKQLDGSIFVSPHNTGGAVDVELIDSKGELVNMGMVVKDWQETDQRIFYTDCNLIDDEAKENREILLELMQSQDFVNYPTEWWHYSYGDRYWAYHKNQDVAFYGAVEQ